MSVEQQENLFEDYYKLARNPEFERLVSQATEQAVMEMDQIVANEVKLRYVTHIFARTLDEVAKWLIKPDMVN